MRKIPAMNHCVVSFDGDTDVLGNEIFRVDMTVNPFSVYPMVDYFGYSFIGHAMVLLKATDNVKLHTTPVEDLSKPIYTLRHVWWLDTFNGIYEIPDVNRETFYFVIKGDTVEPFSKVRMDRVEPVPYRQFTGKAGPIVRIITKKKKK